MPGLVQMERQVSNTCEWISKAAIGLWIDGCGRAKSPASDEPTIRFTGVSWLDAQCHTTGQRDATGERSVTLAKEVMYYITHLAEHDI